MTGGVLGHGIDVVDVARVRSLLDRHGERFVARVLTDVEATYCRANPKRFAEHVAVRFAAKEAVVKSLGTGLRGGIAWTDVEVTRDPLGKPGVALRGSAAAAAARLGVVAWHVSLSHTATTAAASVIAVGP